MIPYDYNMVDMGGIDLGDFVGKTYPGLFNKIINAINDCGVAILYNWFCAGIRIPPAHVNVIVIPNVSLAINGIVFIKSDDTVYIPSMTTVPIIEAITVLENGIYSAPSGVDGFSPVSVSVPNTYTVEDEGKVVHNQELIAQTAREEAITASGTYDTTLNNSVEVSTWDRYRVFSPRCRFTKGGGTVSFPVGSDGNWSMVISNASWVSVCPQAKIPSSCSKVSVWFDGSPRGSTYQRFLRVYYNVTNGNGGSAGHVPSDSVSLAYLLNSNMTVEALKNQARIVSLPISANDNTSTSAPYAVIDVSDINSDFYLYLEMDYINATIYELAGL